MALTYQTIGTAYDDATFVQRVRGYLSLAGAAVYNENAGTANHANRLLWAEAVANDVQGWAVRMAAAVAGQNAGAAGTTLASLTDANIQTAVDGLINWFTTVVV